MQRINIESRNMEFKHLLSGPAPVGRMLNYIYKAGSDSLYHINGYRTLDFTGNVGSAWTTEFMIGLDLLTLGSLTGNKYELLLTEKGNKIYEDIRDNYTPFNEGTGSGDMEFVKRQMETCNSDLLKDFYDIFVVSVPFMILKEYLNEYGFSYDKKDAFMDDLFETVKTVYDVGSKPYNRASRTPTSRNRVPSLLQLCVLFNMLEITDNTLRFDIKNVNILSNDITVKYTEKEFGFADYKNRLILADVEKLVKMYGEDGTQLVETITRNSNLQRMFKHNLMVSQQRRCAVCGLNTEELLVGSHIRPAVKCDTVAKADYNNGLLLCCNHDKLFDRYLITFNFSNGKIIISKAISEEDKTILGIDYNVTLDDSLLSDERREYLKEHNEEFVKKENER